MSITFSREDGCWNCWNRLTFYPWKDAAFPSKRCHLWREPEVHNLMWSQEPGSNPGVSKQKCSFLVSCFSSAFSIFKVPCWDFSHLGRKKRAKSSMLYSQGNSKNISSELYPYFYTSLSLYWFWHASGHCTELFHLHLIWCSSSFKSIIL